MSARLLILSITIVGSVFVGFFVLKGSYRDTIDKSSDQKPALNEEVDLTPLFRDITKDCGIEFTYRNGEETANHLSILESLGGGAGLIDFDGDGLLDVCLPGGGAFTGADKKEIVGLPTKLFRNLGNGKFRDVTTLVGLDKLAQDKLWIYSHGVAVADFDRDGWSDLLVTGWGGVVLFRNVANKSNDAKSGRRFEDVTAQAGLHQGIDWATSAGFGDLDGDGYPDLYLCQYVDWSWQNHPPCTYDGKISDVCPPKNFSGLPHKLYRNTGKGSFLDVSKEAGLRLGGPNDSKGLGVLIVDVDGDRKPDVYVANDTVDNFLYLNRSTPGKIRLEERGQISGVALDDRGTANGSMGLDAGDPERTGKPTLWVTNYENELHALYRNECRPGMPFFHFRTAAVGIATIGQRYVGWGTAFLDVDLDGWEDIVVANGHAIRFPTGKNSSRKQLAVLLLNRQGKFVDSSQRIGDYQDHPHLGRGLAAGDLDNDGRFDLVISNVNEPTAILKGIGGRDHHWIGIQLLGKEHSCLVGSKLTLESSGIKQYRFAKGGGSYASASDKRFLIGLADATSAEVTVTWPDGTEQRYSGLKADRYYRLLQGTDSPRPYPEPR